MYLDVFFFFFFAVSKHGNIEMHGGTDLKKKKKVKGGDYRL